MVKRGLALLLALLLTGGMIACGARDGYSFQPGVREDNTYTSRFLALHLTLAADWSVYSDRQLARLAGLDSADDEALRQQLEDGGAIYDLYALRQTDNAFLYVSVQRAVLFDGVPAGEADYAAATVKGLPAILAETGVIVRRIDRAAVPFAGESHAALTLEASMPDGTALFETMVLLRVGEYMVSVTAATFHRDDVGSLLELFQVL
ncbi:MAG: hypothetical protein E7426_07080 [Ruminococcaceae bacterium]|nr:hypothetical protein [Oscillospiraceae bacterium]